MSQAAAHGGQQLADRPGQQRQQAQEPPHAAAGAAAAPANPLPPPRHHNTRRAAAQAACHAPTAPATAGQLHVQQQPLASVQSEQPQAASRQAPSSEAAGHAALPPRPTSPRLAARWQQQAAQPAVLQQPQQQQMHLPPLAEPSSSVSWPSQSTPDSQPEQQAPAGAPAAQQQAVQQQQQQPQQQPSAAVAAAAPAGEAAAEHAGGAPQHEHNTRQRAREAHRKVRFAQGPWADKFRTHDGHPDHEGQLARQRRSMGAGWGRDLTPSAVRAVEAELGEACRPSIDRLKRRVGLLPLRKRPREYYILINGGHLADPAAANGSGPDAANGGSANGSSTSTSTSGSDDSEGEGEHAQEQPAAKRARGGQRGAAAKQQQQLPTGAAYSAVAEAASGRPAKQPAAKLKQHPAGAAAPAAAAAAADASAQPMPPSGATLASADFTFARKRGAAGGEAGSAKHNGAAAQPKGGAVPAGKRGGSQRLGGLSGPVGSSLLGTFSKR